MAFPVSHWASTTSKTRAWTRPTKLVEAQKKTYAQVEVVEEKEMLTCDAILTRRAALSDLLMKDLEFVETRLGRDAGEAEKAVLNKLAETLISEKPVSAAGLTAEELKAISAHNFYSNKPVVVAGGSRTDGHGGAAGAGVPGERLDQFSDGRRQGKPRVADPRRDDGLGGRRARFTPTSRKGFIRAEIISFADFVEGGGETGAKRAGKQRLELKTYVMQDYDVTNFRFNK